MRSLWQKFRFWLLGRLSDPYLVQCAACAMCRMDTRFITTTGVWRCPNPSCKTINVPDAVIVQTEAHVASYVLDSAASKEEILRHVYESTRYKFRAELGASMVLSPITMVWEEHIDRDLYVLRFRALVVKQEWPQHPPLRTSG